MTREYVSVLMVQNMICPCCHHGTGWLEKAGAIHRKDGTVTPRFRCSACGTKFVATIGTALYRLRHSDSLIKQALADLSTGNSISAVARVYSLDRRTVKAWLVRAVDHPESLELVSDQVEALRSLLLRLS